MSLSLTMYRAVDGNSIGQQSHMYYCQSTVTYSMLFESNTH